MPVIATEYLRNMRGGAQTHLVKANDGNYYVLKLTNNPQGLRILANEFIAQRLLQYLRIPAPNVAAVELTPEFLAANPACAIKLGPNFLPTPPGWHFGSRFPGTPYLTSVFDLVPDIQIPVTRNLQHFAAALVFDKWTGNTDGRQCIFYRAKLADALAPEDLGETTITTGMVASMIDHGFCFNGIYWDFPDAPGHGLYPRPIAYNKIFSWSAFSPWLEMVEDFPEAILERALLDIPRPWLTPACEQALPKLYEQLLRRRRRVRGLIDQTHTSFKKMFLNWK
jgi:hypothetical protein